MKSTLASGSIQGAIAGNGTVGLKSNSAMLSSVALCATVHPKLFYLSPFSQQGFKVSCVGCSLLGPCTFSFSPSHI